MWYFYFVKVISYFLLFYIFTLTTIPTIKGIDTVLCSSETDESCCKSDDTDYSNSDDDGCCNSTQTNSNNCCEGICVNPFMICKPCCGFINSKENKIGSIASEFDYLFATDLIQPTKNTSFSVFHPPELS